MKLGIDLGSSTSKIAVLDDSNKIIFSDYKKHNGKPVAVLEDILKEFPHNLKNKKYSVAITGTAGMGLSQRANFGFIQEVLAVSKSVKEYYPNAEAVVELGGEDAKFIYFPKHGAPVMRMNGSCAGGTGSFIEQIATLLNFDLKTLNINAKKSTKKLTIAARCGVFAKTDVQAHLNQGQSKDDIARSVFRAVANQYVVSLVSGIEIKGDVIFAGGPLTFFDVLRDSFREVYPIGGEYYLPDNSQVFIAAGAALNSDEETEIDYDVIIEKINDSKGEIALNETLEPLFKDKNEYKEFYDRHSTHSIKKAEDYSGNLFMGIDAGSTTSKIALINEKKELIEEFYSSNRGEPLTVIREGFNKFKKYLPQVKTIFTTGYGEELVKHAFGLDGGVVETFAHYRAGLEFSKDIDFVLDIGGQDVKAIYLEDGVVTDVDLNEACSSGTGSFIETFARIMNMTLQEFVDKSLYAKAPIDLGTRCTVFMNSKVKDALREGYDISDISAGLCYSVVRNSLYKVIRVQDLSKLGKNILVQGGTFKNNAVLRAFEKVTGQNVIRIEQAHLMGAFGAAVYALDQYGKNGDTNKDYSGLNSSDDIVQNKKYLKCKGCGNNCNITKFIFRGDRNFYVGNNCEKYFSNNEKKEEEVPNFFNKKYEIFYTDVINSKIENNGKKIGLPLVLEMFEHFPFYFNLFQELGFDVVTSHWTTDEIYSKGIRTQTVDNICFPAKVVNGHVENLMEIGVDRIFYPIVQFEKKSDDDAVNGYNCPIVTGYPIVIDNTYNKKIKIDTLEVSFIDEKLALKKFIRYFKENYNINSSDVKKAFKKAEKIENELKNKYLDYGKSIVDKAVKNNKPLIVIAGRPYHIDPLVNHGLMEQANILGAWTINEEVASMLYEGDLSNVEALTQWSYHNRMYRSALWLKKLNYSKSAILQLTSFGCGPDAVTIDEMNSLSKEAGRPYVNIKIDEMANLGAVKIRIKSLLKTIEDGYNGRNKEREEIKEFDNKKDKNKTLFGPYFADVYNEVLEAVFANNGYNLIIPKEQKRDIVEIGLKYVNNDMCYPAVIVIGDLINQLNNYKGDLKDATVVLSETGGQCRASNYSAQLKQALRNAGYTDVKVGTLNTSAGKDSFNMSKIKMLADFGVGFNLADAINRMKLAIRPYEKNKGETDKLVDVVKEELRNFIEKRKFSKKHITRFVDSVVTRFNKIEILDKEFSRVGIVGEIYLKTNDFSNNFVIRWLEEKGFEVEQPGFVKFLEMDYFSNSYNSKELIRKEISSFLRGLVLNKTFDRYHSIIEKRLEKFKRYRKEHSIKDYIDENIISTSMQFGEAWLLPLEVSLMARHGVKHVIALQPFGCISNHIIAKGMVNKISEEFPELGFLSLDFESGSTNVNIFNRLELLLK